MNRGNRCYWKIARWSLFFFYFIFFDTKEYVADRLFVRHKVRVWFGKEFEKKESPFVLILCRVRKKDVERFVAALDEMERTMILKGHSDYPGFCARMDGMLQGMEPA